MASQETGARIRFKLGAGAYDPLHSFAVVRNPYDHAVSHFEYMKQYRSKKIARQFENVDFLSYLKMRAAPRRPWHRIFVHLPDQAYFLADRNNDLLVKHILKYETLNADIRALQKQLSIDVTPLTKRNVTKSRNGATFRISEYFGPEETRLVQKIYARDFALFGYEREFRAA